jgi:hypothetical protein
VLCESMSVCLPTVGDENYNYIYEKLKGRAPKAMPHLATRLRTPLKIMILSVSSPQAILKVTAVHL